MARSYIGAATIVAFDFALVGCDARQQAVPDVHDEAALAAIVRQIDGPPPRDPAITAADFKARASTDGMTFYWWAQRRRDTLDGKLGQCPFPAPAVATVADAIAWQRATRPQQAALEDACPGIMERRYFAQQRAEQAQAEAEAAVREQHDQALIEAGQQATADDMACIQRQHEMESQLADADKFAAWLAEHPCRGDPL